MPLYLWSQTAATNASVDPAINFAEGQAPSSVNDSMRAEMAVIAKWWNDINGSLTTGGTSTAFTLTTNSVFDTLAHLDKQSIAFTVNATSGAAPTLNVDGLGAKPIRNSTGVTLPTGALVSGSIYRATYYNTAGEFLLENQAGVLPTNSVVTASITDANVTLAKIVNTGASKLLGNPTGGATVPSEISLDTTLAFSGTSLKVSPSTGLTAALAVDYASKSDQNTGTSNVKAVTPGHQVDNPSSVKAWARCEGRPTANITASYGFTSITRASAGDYTLTFNFTWADTNFVVVGSENESSNVGWIYIPSRTTTTVRVVTLTAAGAASDCNFNIICCGSN